MAKINLILTLLSDRYYQLISIYYSYQNSPYMTVQFIKNEIIIFEIITFFSQKKIRAQCKKKKRRYCSLPHLFTVNGFLLKKYSVLWLGVITLLVRPRTFQLQLLVITALRRLNGLMLLKLFSASGYASSIFSLSFKKLPVFSRENIKWINIIRLCK